MNLKPVREMLEQARNWADAQEPQDDTIRTALFEGHLAYLINEMIKEAREEERGK